MANVVVKAVFLYDDFWDQLTSTLTASATIGEIEPVSIKGLVDETKAKIGRTKMDRLEIFCHGTDTYIHAGTDQLHTLLPKKHMPKLARLKGHFAEDGMVVLYVCEAGKCTNVLSEMAKTLGVEVYATEGDVRPMAYATPFVVSGALVVARRDGSIRTGDDVENVYYYDGSQG
jgi:hypothetical protein